MREAAPPPVILHDYHRHFVFISAKGIKIETLTTNRRQGDPPGMKKAGSSAASPAHPLPSASGFTTAADPEEALQALGADSAERDGKAH